MAMNEDNTSPKVTFRRRRRRKRPRTTSTESCSPRQILATTDSNGQRKAKDANEKDSFATTSEDNLLQSLPVLLYRREILGRRDATVLHMTTKTKRQIRFSQLQSPSSEAVLALEQSGSYFVSLAGGMRDFALALRLYAVPSRSKLEHVAVSSSQRQQVCPLITTIPLLSQSDNEDEDNESPVATTPVQVLVSRDWSVGMAFVHHSSSSHNNGLHNDDALGDLILFNTLPNENVVQNFKCLNVRIAGSEAFTMRNLLWETNCIPWGESSTDLCANVLNLPGHLLLNDEEDGFRMTWVISSEWDALKESYVKPMKESTLSITPSSRDIVTRSDEDVWEEHWSDRYSGKEVKATRVDCSRTLEIAFEAYFRVDALLHDILARRREKFKYQENALPDFHYNLISIDNDGRIASIVIAFETEVRVGRSPPVAVFLEIDLFTQRYEETAWVKKSTPQVRLREWSNTLALTERLKHMRVGPFCSALFRKECGSQEWNSFYSDSNNTYDTAHDKNVEIWERYMTNGPIQFSIQHNMRRPSNSLYPDRSKRVLLSPLSLYPDCDLVTNYAVRNLMPVPFIRCRSLTTEFIYG